MRRSVDCPHLPLFILVHVPDSPEGSWSRDLRCDDVDGEGGVRAHRNVTAERLHGIDERWTEVGALLDIFPREDFVVSGRDTANAEDPVLIVGGHLICSRIL